MLTSPDTLETFRITEQVMRQDWKPHEQLEREFTCPFGSTETFPAFGGLQTCGQWLCRTLFGIGKACPLEKVVLASNVILS